MLGHRGEGNSHSFSFILPLFFSVSSEMGGSTMQQLQSTSNGPTSCIHGAVPFYCALYDLRQTVVGVSQPEVSWNTAPICHPWYSLVTRLLIDVLLLPNL